MRKPKQETVEEILADALLSLDPEHPRPLYYQEAIDAQRLINKRESDFMDAVRYGFVLRASVTPRRWHHVVHGKIAAFKYWITGLRIVHKNRIDNEEW